MSGRVAKGGRLLDRSETVDFTWNGERLTGLKGDTLASALLANDRMMVGRSFKYHRPRGILASGVEEPNALAGTGEGARFTPNVRMTTTPLADGLVARSQNHWPSLAFDLGAVNARLSKLFPAGFYYKTFIHPRAAWKHLFEPVIRQSAGLGAPPAEADADRYEHFHAFADVAVVGGGVAGLAAARAAAGSGARVLVMEQAGHWGGRALVDGGEIDDRPAADWISATVAALGAMPNVTLRTGLMGAASEDHGYLLAAETLSGRDGPAERLWRIRARRIVMATGAIERPVAFAGNDIPGVMLASAMRDFLGLWGVSAGDRVVVVTASDDAYRTALALHEAGQAVAAILDARPEARGALPEAARNRGIRVLEGMGVAEVRGTRRVRGLLAGRADGSGGAGEVIACDAVAMSGGWSPVVHLWSHSGGRLTWDETALHFAPDPARPPRGGDGRGFVIPAGAAGGARGLASVLADAHRAGRRAAEETGARPGDEAAPTARAEAEAAPRAIWVMPARADTRLMERAFLDYQNDVKVSDVQLAAREGYRSVEHTKRYTTLGMATDQGKLSNINGLAILSDALSQPIPATGTTTFRPPYTPVSFGALVGAARGPLFKPLRRTPMDAAHERAGAHWEPVGDWRRPYCFPRPGESVADAVTRETLGVRQGVGLLDASTLGKILVKGPEAGVFLDRLYTNMMSTLAVGKCRYGLMCTENGFLFDDGVVVRLSEDSFLCHTTTGNSDRVHGWMEEWLQTEWWDLRVHVANVTEQWAQVAVAGPRARALLEKLGGDMDLSAGALPFMAWTSGMLSGMPARVFRISFSGELSYEVAVPARHGLALWEALAQAGRALGAMPYGTEALHVLRAEKGFIMIGDETDGTVTPQDLGLGWAISKKKADYIGKRAQERSDLVRPDRLQLVGLQTETGEDVLPDGAHAVEGEGPFTPPVRTIGHVTSSYFSPNCGHSIAMALIERGRERMGETLAFPIDKVRVIRARVVDPVFFDKDGSRLHA